MKNFLAGVCLVSARKRKEEAAGWEGGHGRRDKNDINWWLPAILEILPYTHVVNVVIEAWEKLWWPGKEAQHAVRLTKCICTPN